MRSLSAVFDRRFLIATILCLASSPASGTAPSTEIGWVQVADDSRSFILTAAGEKFTPWGFNCNHDETGRWRPSDAGGELVYWNRRPFGAILEVSEVQVR